MSWKNLEVIRLVPEEEKDTGGMETILYHAFDEVKEDRSEREVDEYDGENRINQCREGSNRHIGLI